MRNDRIHLARFLCLESNFLRRIFIIELNAMTLRTASWSIGIELNIEEILLCFQELITHDDSSRSDSDFLFIFALNRLDGVSYSWHVLTQLFEIELFWGNFVLERWSGSVTKRKRWLCIVILDRYFGGVEFSVNFGRGSVK